jgi:hypothetical protein
MHNLGKVLAFLVVAVAIGALLLTAKLVQVRNSWTVKTAAAKAKFADLQPKVDALEAKIDSLRNEIFRSRELWGTAYFPVETSIDDAGGNLTTNLGTDRQIRTGMLLHGFEVAADGTSVYRGSFLVGDVQNNGSKLKPNFRLSADDVKKWVPGNWRWRNAVPPGYQETFDRQLLSILKDEETMTARGLDLKGQKELLAKAENGLKQREAELVGGEGLAKAQSVEPEFRDGLVSAVQETEEERNKILLTVDELRRAVRNIEADIERLQSENTALVGRLPEPAPRRAVTQKR